MRAGPGGAAHRQERQRQARHAGDGGCGQGLARHQAHHHGEDHQPQHVVGDGGAEHRAGLGGAEGPQVAEDPGGDPDAGGGERRPHEGGGVPAVARRLCGPGPQGERQGHSAHRHCERRPPHRAQVGQVELEAHLQEQEDDPQLAQAPAGPRRPGRARARRARSRCRRGSRPPPPASGPARRPRPPPWRPPAPRGCPRGRLPVVIGAPSGHHHCAGATGRGTSRA